MRERIRSDPDPPAKVNPPSRRLPGETNKPPDHRSGGLYKSGGVLVSHKVPLAVPSALRGLTSGFGMGPGVSLSL